MTTGRINQVYIQSNFSVQWVHNLTNDKSCKLLTDLYSHQSYDDYIDISLEMNGNSNRSE